MIYIICFVNYELFDSGMFFIKQNLYFIILIPKDLFYIIKIQIQSFYLKLSVTLQTLLKCFF